MRLSGLHRKLWRHCFDTVKALHEFSNLAESKFLFISKEGVLYEKDIEKNDLKTFPQICDEVLNSTVVIHLTQP
jgi:hypothetical protein